MTEHANHIDVQTLHQLLFCDPERGKLWWKVRGPEWFEDRAHGAEHNRRKWNARYAGNEAFVTVSRGYRVGSIFGHRYNAHHVIWAIATGAWPLHQIDHINGRRDDNRLCNLRDVPSIINCRNQKMPQTNTLGAVGIEFVKRTGRWRARIQVSRRSIHLGYFATREEAILARKSADAQHGFHPNHGRAI